MYARRAPTPKSDKVCNRAACHGKLSHYVLSRIALVNFFKALHAVTGRVCWCQFLCWIHMHLHLHAGHMPMTNRNSMWAQSVYPWNPTNFHVLKNPAASGWKHASGIPGRLLNSHRIARLGMQASFATSRSLVPLESHDTTNIYWWHGGYQGFAALYPHEVHLCTQGAPAINSSQVRAQDAIHK